MERNGKTFRDKSTTKNKKIMEGQSIRRFHEGTIGSEAKIRLLKPNRKKMKKVDYYHPNYKPRLLFDAGAFLVDLGSMKQHFEFLEYNNEGNS